MNTLKQPKLRDYRNSEFLQYMKDVLELVNGYDVLLLQLTEQRDTLARYIETLATVFEQEKQQKMTVILESLDAKRDAVFTGIMHLLKGNSHHLNSSKREAAKRLLFHLKSYGNNVTRMNYQAETAVIDSMLSEWKTVANLQEAVGLLELSEWIVALQAINTQFNEQYVVRVSEVAGSKVPSFSTLRADAKIAYRSLVVRINAFVVLNTNVLHAQLHDEIYELARKYNQMLKVRSKA